MINFYPLLVPFAPLISAILAAIPQSISKDKDYKIGWWIIFSGFISSLFLLWRMIQSPEPINFVLFTSSWDVLPVVQFTIDRLSAVMMAVISGFGTLLYLYSARYLHQDSGLRRYQTFLALKVSLQIFMVACTDLITLFVFWQVLGWLLTLLSHNFGHFPTAKSTFRIFITLRAGDLAFLAGTVLAYHIYGTVQFTELFERAALNQSDISFLGTGFAIPAATLVTLLIFIAAMCKSAQFPLHMWLADSLYSPTPISALLHAGGINAGGFLLTRLAPLFILSPITLHLALVVGLVTAVLGTSMMLVQNDIKKTLAYSTMGQMGYMIMECGLGAFSLAIFHLVAHGLFKANAFLNCGKGIHEARLHPTKAPELSGNKPREIGWVSAFIFSFLVPLFITFFVHYLLGISFYEHQGLFILFLFSWITVSQAMVTLFRLNKGLLTKGFMLLATALVAVLYFLAAEKFTHFLIPEHHLVEAYYKAASLPSSFFMVLATVIVLSVIGVWLLSLSPRKNNLYNSYLLFMNNLYMEGMLLRFFEVLKKAGRKIEKSPLVFSILLLIPLGIAFMQVIDFSSLPLKSMAFLVISALLVPIFPFHGFYLNALTRAPRRLARILCALIPLAGIYVMVFFLPELPKGILSILSLLAIASALWGSIRALMQVSVTHRLSYGGLALYSILWWYFAQTGQITFNVIYYALALTLSWTALYLLWDRVRVRYGNLNLNQIGGLFKPMPRLAICMGLLIMAALGFPPFGLLFGYLGILLSPATGLSYGILAIILTWFLACWYLFKLMQSLLFGPYRKDLIYEDLGFLETMGFVLMIVLLTVPSGVLQGCLMEVIQ